MRRDEFPSNTMYAFRKALAAGADMLELDVGVTKDKLEDERQGHCCVEDPPADQAA